MNRKKWSNEEKVTIVLEVIKGANSITPICARHGVSATQAYKWQERFCLEGDLPFRTRDGKEMIR